MKELIIALAAILLQPAPQQPAISVGLTTDEIVVLAQRMHKVRWEYEARNGAVVKCLVRRSSGSPSVDLLVCQATEQCAAEQPTDSDVQLIPCIKDRVKTLYTTRMQR